MSAQSERVQAVEQLIAWATGKHICPRCDGEGEIRFNASPDCDPQHDDHTPCRRCGGTGEIA